MSLQPENQVVILIGCLNIRVIMYNYGQFLQDFGLIFSGLHWWHSCMEFKHLNNLYCKPKIALVFETELLN